MSYSPQELRANTIIEAILAVNPTADRAADGHCSDQGALAYLVQAHIEYVATLEG